MGTGERGTLTPEMRKGRDTLTVRNPFIETCLAVQNLDGVNIGEVTRFGNAILHARNLWADEHRHGRRYSDRQTAQAKASGLRPRGGGR